MKITEVRIFPTESKDGKLKAFATMTFDDWFVVRNVKIIQGNSGLFVAMPSRKAVVSCTKCRSKNVIGSKYCNQCGARVEHHEQASTDGAGDGRGGHMDIAHPITQECRVYIQKEVLDAYSKDPRKESHAPESFSSGSDKPEIDKAASVEQPQTTDEEKKPDQDQSDEPVSTGDTKDIEL